MEDTNNYYPLQQLGYREDYAITLQGEIVETANKQPIRKGKGERYKLTTADGKSVYRAIKPLYRRAFGKEYSLDLIEDLDGEEWKPIDRRGKYYISNRGRVKSFQGKRTRR